MSRIGDLTVRIGADITRLQTGMRRAQGEVSQAVKAMAAVGAAAAAAAAGVVAFTKSSADGARELRIMASVANTTTQELQRISFATRSVGIEQDKLADILKDVNDRVGDFLNTGGGEMADFFEKVAPQVGVTAEQFRNLSGPQALQLYYDTLQRANLSQAEMTFYLESMANDATALAPLLRDNGAALNELANEADNLGIVLSDLDIAMLGEFSKEFQRAGGIIKGVADLIAVDLAPILTVVINRINEAAIESGGWGEVISEAIESSIATIGFLMDAMEGVKRTFQVVGRGGALAFIEIQIAVAKLAEGIYSGPIDALNSLIDLYNKIPALPQIEDPVNQFKFVEDIQGRIRLLEGAATAARQDIQNVLTAPMPSDFLDDLMDEVAAKREELKAKLEGIETGGGEGITLPGVGMGGEDGEGESYAEKLQRRLDLLRDSLATEREIEMERYQQANEDLKESLELKLITKQEYDELEFENHQAHLERIAEIDKQAAAQRNRLQEQQARDQEKREQDVANYIIGTREDIMRRSAQLLDMFAGESKAAAIASIAINKALSIAQATQNTAVAVTKALAIDPTGGLASRVATLGAVQVGIIAATGVAQAAGVLSGGGSSGGGSTATTGSAGGSTPQAQQPAQPAAPSGTLTVRGLSAGSLITGEAVAELANELLEYQRNGGRVVIA